MLLISSFDKEKKHQGCIAVVPKVRNPPHKKTSLLLCFLGWRKSFEETCLSHIPPNRPISLLHFHFPSKKKKVGHWEEKRLLFLYWSNCTHVDTKMSTSLLLLLLGTWFQGLFIIKNYFESVHVWQTGNHQVHFYQTSNIIINCDSKYKYWFIFP